MPPSNSPFLNTRQLADLTGLSVGFFEKQRSTGIEAIPHVKVGRAVLYRREDVDAYFAARLRINTSDPRFVAAA